MLRNHVDVELVSFAKAGVGGRVEVVVRFFGRVLVYPREGQVVLIQIEAWHQVHQLLKLLLRIVKLLEHLADFRFELLTLYI